uniref:Uncharacterized protein n=1 Tax=Arundo donax TaxID=35708 RepID=A0A0A8YVR8_ARUDO
MEKELRRMDDDERRRRCSFNQRCPTLFAKARALSEEFGAGGKGRRRGGGEVGAEDGAGGGP